jgi:hypothetical protein
MPMFHHARGTDASNSQFYDAAGNQTINNYDSCENTPDNSSANQMLIFQCVVRQLLMMTGYYLLN